MNLYTGEDGLNDHIRAACAASVINSMAHKYSRVVYDFGCGNKILAEYLRREKEYYPVDFNDDEDVFQCDLNEEYPKSHPGVMSERVASCLGVLEYLSDVWKFFEYLRKNFNAVLFSYIDTANNKPPCPGISRPDLVVVSTAFDFYSTVRFICDVPYSNGKLYFACRR